VQHVGNFFIDKRRYQSIKTMLKRFVT